MAETAVRPSPRSYSNPFSLRSTMQAIFTSPTGGTAAFVRSRPPAPSPRSPAAAMDLWAMEAPPRQPPSAATCMAWRWTWRGICSSPAMPGFERWTQPPGGSPLSPEREVRASAVNGPQNIAVDGSGNVYFSDENNLRVRKLTPAQIVAEGVTNSATAKAGGVSPGEIITIWAGPGVSVGPATPVGLQLDASGRVATNLGGTAVTFDGTPAPFTYVSSGQINAVVPYEVAGQASTQLQVTFQGKPTNTVVLPVVASAPGVFAITNQDGSVNTPSNPAPPGGVLVLYGTGEGQTIPAGVDGNVNNTVFPKPVQLVSVTLGGQGAQILYAGAGPGFVAGVLQVDLQIPPGVSGTVPLQLIVGTGSTPAGLTVTVRAQ